MVFRGHLGPEVCQVSQESKGHRVSKGQKVREEKEGLSDLPDKWVLRATKEFLGKKVDKESLVHKA